MKTEGNITYMHVLYGGCYGDKRMALVFVPRENCVHITPRCNCKRHVCVEHESCYVVCHLLRYSVVTKTFF